MQRAADRPLILIVDDEPRVRRAAERVLEKPYRVVTLAGPEEALHEIGTLQPALAIIDILMPHMNGFELMGRLKAVQPDLDVIVMTGDPFELDDNLIRAIDQGAFYFLQKPFDRRVLLTLVSRCMELRSLRHQREQHVQKLEQELREAKVFQQKLMPPRQGLLADVSLHAVFEPCDQLAGDLYDYVPVNGDKLAILVADVSGHGTGAAMMTGIVKSSFRAAHVEEYSPVAVMQRIADNLRSFEPGRFVTAFAATIDRSCGEIEYASAGHPSAILLSRQHSPQDLESTGPLISSGIPDAKWDPMILSFDDSHQLLVYTDGLDESRGPSGFFDRKRVIDSLCNAVNEDAPLLERLLADLRAFTGKRPPTDDITLLLVDPLVRNIPSMQHVGIATEQS